MIIKLINTLLTVIAGIGAAIVIYWVLNKLAELLPGRWEDRVKPYFYILPAISAISLFIVYPAIQTVVYSFANAQSPGSWVSTTTPGCSRRAGSGRPCSPPWCGSSWRHWPP
jgi:alpha-glucoside transport system permease protein